MKRTTVWPTSQSPVKRPLGALEVLTEFEERRLARAYTHGKTGAEIHEAEWQVLLAWARAHRLGNLFVDMLIAGDVRPVVRGQDVLVEAIV